MNSAQTYHEGDWDKALSAINRFLMYTQQMTAWTNNNVDNDDPDLLALEQFVTYREDALNDLKALYEGLQCAPTDLSESEEKARQGCASLISDVLVSESDGTDNITKMSNRLKEKLRSKKEARDVISAYGAVAYNQSASIGSQFNQAR